MSTAVRAERQAPPERDDRVKARPLLARMLSRAETGPLVGAVAIFVIFVSVAPVVHTQAGISSILYTSAVYGIMVVPVSLLMIGGEIDLSAGVAITSSGLTASMFSFQLSTNVWVGVVAALVVSLAIGFFNGWLLTKTKLPSFLVTLGTFFMLRGLNFGITKWITGNVSSDATSDMAGFSSAKSVFAGQTSVDDAVWKIPIVFWIVLVVVATWVLLKTRVGSWIFASGGDANAARAVGIPVKWVKIGLYMSVGFGAWVVGMHQVFSQQGSVQTAANTGLELYFIAAAVIGGCLLTGGYGSALGAALGAIIIGTAQQGIVYAGWSSDWIYMFLGVLVLLATLLNLLVQNQASKR